MILSVIGDIPNPCKKDKRTPKKAPIPRRHFWWKDECGKAIMKMLKKDRPDPKDYYDDTAYKAFLADFTKSGEEAAGFFVSHANLMRFVFNKPGVTTVGYATGTSTNPLCITLIPLSNHNHHNHSEKLAEKCVN